MVSETRIDWHLMNREKRYPFGLVPADLAAHFQPLGFPPPWRERPWIYADMVVSANGIVAWKPEPGKPHPVEIILGGNPRRPERLADLFFMRWLRCFGACSVGAETQRVQRGLIQTPQEAWEREAYPEFQPLYDALYRLRRAHGFSHHPLNIRYSQSGNLDLTDPLFNTPGVQVVVITTEEGADRLIKAGSDAKDVKLLVEPVLDAKGLRRAHERLLEVYDARRLSCEGGEGILRSLREAEILDEVFVTTTDVEIDTAGLEGVKQLPDYGTEGAALIAEGKISPESAWTFRRWRFNQR